MRKKIYEEIEVPAGISLEAGGRKIKLSKGNEIAERKINYDFKADNKKIIFSCEKPSKKDKRLIKTSIAHINNMLSGLNKKFVYKMQICFVHFPMNVSVKGSEVIIKNFLGEVRERKAKILEGTNVKIEKEIITIESSDKEKAGQTAANIEQATRISKKDRRIFQDGIYITEKQKGRRKNE